MSVTCRATLIPLASALLALTLPARADDARLRLAALDTTLLMVSATQQAFATPHHESLPAEISTESQAQAPSPAEEQPAQRLWLEVSLNGHVAAGLLEVEVPAGIAQGSDLSVALDDWQALGLLASRAARAPAPTPSTTPSASPGGAICVRSSASQASKAATAAGGTGARPRPGAQCTGQALPAGHQLPGGQGTQAAAPVKLALIEALNSEAFYIGALGSRRNQATRKARLAEHFDLTEAALARLHGPVGLQLGAQTPAEIAVSIVAEIVQVKNTVVKSSGEAVALSSLDIGDSRITACALG